MKYVHVHQVQENDKLTTIRYQGKALSDIF